MKRRKFLKTTALGVLPLALDSFYLRALGADSVWGSIAAATTETDHVLVIVQLIGGNDGLNTLVPLDQYANLYKARKNVIIPENKIIKANGFDNIGFHPSISGLKNLFSEGKLQIIQNVGYPDQNYSHFRSTDIWMSGSDSNQYLPSGWAGRYLNHEYTNYPSGYPNSSMPDPLGIQIGSMLSLGMMGPSTSMGMAISNPNDVFTRTTGISDPAPNTPAGEELKYLRELAVQTGKYTSVVFEAAKKVTSQGNYPTDNELAAQLKVVAKLIAGGLKTRVYMVNINGFDTHSNQTDSADTTKGIHANLLKKVSEAIDAFVKDCAFLGIDKRVLGITMSEFGRRILSNDSQGTDHGASAPMFIFGQPVKGNKIIGKNPVISANVKSEDNLPMEFDFRSIYSTVLQDWFCLPEEDAEQILLKKFDKLDILSEPCSTAHVRKINKSGDSYLECYPNPFVQITHVKYYSPGGWVNIEVTDVSGRLVETVVQNIIPKGTFEQDLDLGHLSPGTYLIRFQSGLLHQVKYIQKVH